MVHCASLPCLPKSDVKLYKVELRDQAIRRLTILDNAESLRDLAGLRSNRLEALSGDRAGEYSIRINRQWRICFRWGAEGPYDVEIVDYHR